MKIKQPEKSQLNCLVYHGDEPCPGYPEPEKECKHEKYIGGVCVRCDYAVYSELDKPEEKCKVCGSTEIFDGDDMLCWKHLLVEPCNCSCIKCTKQICLCGGNCDHCKPENKRWEEEFERKFTAKNKEMPGNKTMLFEPTTTEIKQFIHTLLAQDRHELIDGVTRIISFRDPEDTFDDIEMKVLDLLKGKQIQTNNFVYIMKKIDTNFQIERRRGDTMSDLEKLESLKHEYRHEQGNDNCDECKMTTFRNDFIDGIIEKLTTQK